MSYNKATMQNEQIKTKLLQDISDMELNIKFRENAIKVKYQELRALRAKLVALEAKTWP